MHAVTHLQRPTTQLQSVHLPAFLSPKQPCLAIVRHSSIDFLALPGGDGGDGSGGDNGAATPPPLSTLATVEINARVLRIAPYDGGAHAHAQRLAVLTDHHDPRLIILRAHYNAATRQYRVVSTYRTLLNDPVRPPAEMGIGLWHVAGSTQDFLIAHTHSGTLRVIPAAADIRALQRSFDVRLPHPNIVSIAPLQSSHARPTIAVLSISSIPSTLPGLGTQCLPVLSFHEIDDDKRKLEPVRWPGPERQVQVPAQPSATSDPHNRRASSSSASAAPAASSSSTSQRKGRGPQAMGRTLTPDQARAREVDLAQSDFAKSHVPIAFADALGAHMLTALPAAAGGGVVVWGETSILIVPPPADRYKRSGSETAGGGGGVSAKARDKRRKSSNASDVPAPPPAASSALSTSPDSAILARSPSQQANEHGKRRRSSVKGGMAGAGADADAAKIHRISLPRPVQFIAADIVSEGNSASGILVDPDGSTAAIHLLFATGAGYLHDLKITLTRAAAPGSWSPSSMHATKIGRIPRPSGPASLTYLGEGFVYVASASGDSALVHLSQFTPPSDGSVPLSDADDATAPSSSPLAIRSPERKGFFSSAAHLHTSYHAQQPAHPLPDFPQSTTLSMHTVHSTPCLAPTLDFVLDGDVNGPSAGAQARVVAACGTGSDGALAVVRNGVAVEELGAVQVADARRVWSVAGGDVAGADAAANPTLLVCAGVNGTSVISIGAAGVADVTADLPGPALVNTLQCGQLADATWAHVSDSAVTVFAPGGDVLTWSAQQFGQQKSPINTNEQTITAAHVADNHVLVGLASGKDHHVALLAFDATHRALTVKSSMQVDDEVSAVHFAHGVAAVGQWSSHSVRLFAMPSLSDVTPGGSGGGGAALGALPRSLLIHAFDDDGGDGANANAATTPYLLAGLSNGSVVSYALSLPTRESLSQTVGLLDKKVSVLGRRPVRLAPCVTTLGKRAVLATNGEVPTVVWAQEGRVSYSALGCAGGVAACAVAVAGEGEGGGADVPSVAAPPALAVALPDRIELLSVGEIGRLDITKTHLGCDNPIAITGVAPDDFGHYRYFVVLTHAFKPEGSATRPDRPSKILVYESSSLGGGATGAAPIAEVHLDATERANCVATAQLGDGRVYVVVGTGYVKPEETEVMSGRILGFTLDDWTGQRRNEWDERELRLQFEEQVDGNVFAVEGVAGFVVAAINSDVITFSLERDGRAGEGDIPGSLSLSRRSRWGSAFMATSLERTTTASSSRVVVGDALRSMSILDVEPATGKLTEVARDCDPFWNSACAPLDTREQLFIGADISLNLYTTQRGVLSAETRRRLEQAEERRRERAAGGDEDAARALASSNATTSATRPNLDASDGGKWSHVMERRGAWHYGDLVNRFRQGSLVSRATLAVLKRDGGDGGGDGSVIAGDADADAIATSASTALPVDQRLLFCTAAGAIAVVTQLDTEASRLLSVVERNLQAFYAEREGGGGGSAGGSGDGMDVDVENGSAAAAAAVAATATTTVNAGSIPYDEWRALRTDHRTSPPAGFLDGDLLLRFTRELSASEKVQVLSGGVGGGVALGVETRDRVEELIDALGRA